jgi:hypothetical protein
MTDSRTLLKIAIVLCVIYTLGFVSIAVQHVLYPGFTEAMEGDVLQHVERAAAGRPIYTTPTEEFIPLAYVPGYYYFAAPFHWLFGDHLGGPRLASSLAAIGAAVAFGWIVYRESNSVAACLVTVALFFAGYRVKDENLTTALPDALLLLWLGLGWAMIVGRQTLRTEIAAVVFLILALVTKQQGLLLGGCTALFIASTTRGGDWSLREKSRVAPAFAWSVAGLSLFLFGNSLFGQFFNQFTFLIPSGWERSWFHSFERLVLVSFLFVPFAWLGAATFAFKDGVRWQAFKQPLPFAILTTTLICLYTVSATGSSNNHYIPLFSLLEATAVLGCLHIAQHGPPRWFMPLAIATAIASVIVAGGAAMVNEGHPIPWFVSPLLVIGAGIGWYCERRLSRPKWWAAILLSGQFAASFYLPWDYWPPSDWRAAHADFRSELRRLDFDVAWPDYGAIPIAMTGERIHRFPSWVALEDLNRSRNVPPDWLKVFRNRLTTAPPKWLIAADKLADIPVWKEFAAQYSLENDYEDRFKSLLQLDRHWYGSRSYPRYLYRRAP